MTPVEWGIFGLLTAPFVGAVLLLIALALRDFLEDRRGAPRGNSITKMIGLGSILALALLSLTNLL